MTTPIFSHFPFLEAMALEPRVVGTPTQQHRQVTFERLKAIGEKQLIDAQTIIESPERLVPIWERLTLIDPSLAVKFGVQYLLFCGALHLLGTERHSHILEKANRMELPGCFLMTEIGHGSNVPGVETTAIFDKATDSFVIHSPTLTSTKFLIGNAACDGRMGVCFAQLILDGKECGVNAFLVPLRTDEGQCVEGVRIGDCGEKMGMGGVDNGWVRFTNLRIPRANLLNKFADVDEEGNLIKIKKNVFGETIAALIFGRIFLTAGSAMSLAFLAVILHKKCRMFPVGLLMPIIADAYAFQLAKMHALHNRKDHGLVSGIKAIVSEQTVKTYQKVLPWVSSLNQHLAVVLCTINMDQTVCETFEGDNAILRQLVMKELLKEFSREITESPSLKKIGGLVSYWTKHALHWDAPLYRAQRSVLWGKITISKAVMTKEANQNMLDIWNSNLMDIHRLSDLHIHREIASLFDINDPLMASLQKMYIATHIEPNRAMDKEAYSELSPHLEKLLAGLCQKLNFTDEILDSCLTGVMSSPPPAYRKPYPPFMEELITGIPNKSNRAGLMPPAEPAYPLEEIRSQFTKILARL